MIDVLSQAWPADRAAVRGMLLHLAEQLFEQSKRLVAQASCEGLLGILPGHVRVCQEDQAEGRRASHLDIQDASSQHQVQLCTLDSRAASRATACLRTSVCWSARQAASTRTQAQS